MNFTAMGRFPIRNWCGRVFWWWNSCANYILRCEKNLILFENKVPIPTISHTSQGNGKNDITQIETIVETKYESETDRHWSCLEKLFQQSALIANFIWNWSLTFIYFTRQVWGNVNELIRTAILRIIHQYYLHQQIVFIRLFLWIP